MKLVCRQVMDQIFSRGINWEKVTKLTTGERLNFELGDIKAMIAALHFMLCNAAKYDCEEKVFSLELQQLGLPKDICNTICRSLRANKEKMREHFAHTVMQLPRLTDVEWRVDYMLHSRESKELNTPSVRIAFHCNKPLTNIINGALTSVSDTLRCEISADKFRVLFNELKAARQLMDSFA